VDARTVNPNTAKRVLEIMYTTGDDPAAVVARAGLAMVSDTAAIDEAIAAIFAANPGELARYRGGEEKLFGFFMGQVMRATRGKADPALAKQRLEELIKG
jgi:aspartyl-tRNA(Asn)/glutamyl-tRNA(Gln) amidotransferase subunit B